MKNCFLFFMKCLFIQVWMLTATSSGLAYGQERGSLPLTQSPAAIHRNDTVPDALPKDSLHTAKDTLSRTAAGIINPNDSLSANRIGEISPSDSTSAARDSLFRSVVVGLTDPLDTVSDRIFAYRVLDKNSYARLQVPIDTTLTRFEINNPVMKNYYAGAYLGNTGLSYFPIGFEARKRPSDYLFLDHVSDYIHVPEETTYYQTQMAYTLLDYSSAGSKATNESILKLVHTQNVNKNWNVGLYYDIISSNGQYLNQNAADNGFSFFSAYRGSQYSLYANFNWNNVRMKENGGLADLDAFAEEDGRADTYSVRSQAGKTILLNRSLYFMQSYSPRKLSIGRKKAKVDSVDVSRFTLVQTFKLDWSRREFSDTASYVFREMGTKPNFGTTNTHDSLYFRRVFNHFELMIKEQTRRKFTAGFSIGLLNEFDRYNANIIPDTTYATRENYTPDDTGWGSVPALSGEDLTIYYRGTKKYINTAVTGRFFNHSGRYLNWDFNGKLYLTGYKLGDASIDGTVQIHYYTTKGRNSLLLGGSIENARPSYFLNDYASNWLAWDNDFSQSQEIRLRGEFVSPHLKLKLGAYASQLNNYVFINSKAVPEQTSEPLVTGTAFVEKDIKWWKFGFLFRLYGQYSSHEKIIPLPAFAGYQSTYFETWLVRNVLTMRIGWDFNYNTPYYAYAYMPSSGMFYVQEEKKIGNYPFFDAFLNFQIKRARIFVKTEGLNTLLNNSMGKDYFMVYRYPMGEFRVKFGVSWAFYD